MPPTNMLISQMYGVTTVTFRSNSILDSVLVEAIGQELYKLVDQQALRKLVLDFSAVKVLSSQMIGVLINLHKKSQEIKGRLILCALRPELKKVFEITRLDKILSFAENEDAALKALDAFSKQ